VTDTYTSSLRIIQETVGGNENSWGTLNNAALAMLDEAIAGQVSVSVTVGDLTLSTANNATDQSRPALLILTGTPGATRNVTMPDVKKLSWVYNNCSDGSSITVKSGAGTNVSVSAGCKALVYSDGATNAALIDMYGEGTWTPILADNTGNNFTLSETQGYWSRVGNTLFVTVHVKWTSIGAATSQQLVISGLPLQPRNVANIGSGIVVGNFDGLDTISGTVDIVAFTAATTSKIFFRQCSDNTNSVVLPANSCSASGQINCGGFYFI